MRVLICAATAFEARACRKGIEAAKPNLDFSFLVTGMGLLKAKASLTQWLERNEKPELIISTGFCGTIETELPLGTFVSATELYEWRKDTPPYLVECLVPDTTTECLGRLISSEILVDYQSDLNFLKQSLGPGGPIIVDMESSALARVSLENGIPFRSYRFVTDCPQNSLPRFVYDLTKAVGPDLSGHVTKMQRISSIISGTRELLSEPNAALDLLRNSKQWSEGLQSRWENIAPKLRTLGNSQ